MLPVAKLGLLRGEAPSFNAPPVTHLELKGQGSEPLSQVSKKADRGLGESHVLGGVRGNCVSFTYRLGGGYEREIKRSERLFDAWAPCLSMIC